MRSEAGAIVNHPRRHVPLAESEPCVVTATVTSNSAGCTQVVVVGEIDICSLRTLEPGLAGLPGADTAALVLDLSRVTFCDVAGVRVLLTLLARAHQAAVALELVVSIPVRAVLDGLDLAGRFSLHPDRASALAAVET
jgi:anti-sigma B factor antagonist